ncbi:uncharacterized protein LOC127805510 [Diospyros lotus]|uniref:uncharacterized protein LOC127805510 n=1 Tax=Diospyros lotus TaxID=55363 RepID=UPI002254BCA0|nr:uncharacterized protein LOC127805510 [Diospyros lotus]XP_052198232.1 uncharacterized protein LOC127805510 [Diospyros lotus]
MYVTRLLSRCLRSPEYLSLPPEGPNSGYLVLQDEESETTTCFGLCKNRYLSDLPFPQNKDLTIRYSSGSGKNRRASHYYIALIPVLNQPLSSNRYYAMKPHGSHKGEAYACSTENNMSACCFCKCIKDVKPMPFDPNDIYQQFHIGPYEGACNARGLFTATSIAPDGFPPYFMRRKGWEIYTGTPKNYKLGEALGVNNGLRSRLPDFNFPPHYKTSGAIVVGKWYCPFMFIRDGKFKDQMKRSMFYEMTLEQRWEQIFACENNSSQGNAVTVDATVQIETAFIEGREATWDESNQANGVVWFRSFGAGGETTIGLSSLIVYRMRWEQQRAGWTSSGTGLVRVSRTEEFAGSGGWKKYGCYLLVERFVLKRMDGSLSLARDFKHTHVVGSKWE